MRTAAQRIAKYEARMQSTQIDPVLANINVQQMANFAIYELDFYPRQVKLRDILDTQVLLPSQYIRYEAFAGEMYALIRRSTGAAAVQEATVLVAKYTGPCPAPVLKAIALTVFGITVP